MFNEGKPAPPPRDFVALLAEVLAELPKLQGARCRGLPAVFEDTDNPDLALALCAGCPELNPCRTWALSRPGTVSGVVGGMVLGKRRHHHKAPV